MSWKIYRSGNYVYIENTVTGISIEGGSASIVFDKLNTSDEEYRVLKYDKDILGRSIPLSEMVDENDTPYTSQTFKTFKETYTGFKSGAGGSASGFVDYNDTSTTASPIDISSGEGNLDTWIDLPNNGLGSFTDLTYLPPPITGMLDDSTGYLDFSDFKLGDQILLRIALDVTTLSPNTIVDARLLLASNETETGYFFDFAHRYYKSNTLNDQFVFSVPFDMGNLPTLENFGKLQVRADNSATVINLGFRAYLTIK